MAPAPAPATAANRLSRSRVIGGGHKNTKPKSGLFVPLFATPLTPSNGRSYLGRATEVLAATLLADRLTAKTGSKRRAQIGSLFDHLVDAGEQRRRHFEAERGGSNQIDHEIELGRLLNRNVRRLRAAQNLIDIIGGAPEQVAEVRSIGHEASDLNQLALRPGGR